MASLVLFNSTGTGVPCYPLDQGTQYTVQIDISTLDIRVCNSYLKADPLHIAPTKEFVVLASNCRPHGNYTWVVHFPTDVNMDKVEIKRYEDYICITATKEP